jgi:hypothetical protein
MHVVVRPCRGHLGYFYTHRENRRDLRWLRMSFINADQRKNEYSPALLHVHSELSSAWTSWRIRLHGNWRELSSFGLAWKDHLPTHCSRTIRRRAGLVVPSTPVVHAGQAGGNCRMWTPGWTVAVPNFVQNLHIFHFSIFGFYVFLFCKFFRVCICLESDFHDFLPNIC